MFGRKRKKKQESSGFGGDVAEAAVEGGCCLFHVLSAVALVGLAGLPLLLW
ncbi:MAG TPA: hypothetical protein VGB54_07620 [Allosphingosinicella sp.]|jgi:hypothetical protein